MLAVLVLALAGCATGGRGTETIPVARAIGRAQDATAAARADGKQVRRLSGGIANHVATAAELQRRIGFKAIRALKILNR